MTRFSKRTFLVLLAGATTATALVAADPNQLYALITPDTEAQVMTPPEAFAAAQDGRILLIDIRRPDEWAATGSGEGAHRVDLRRDDFADVLEALSDGNKDTPIALICARGVRSARTTNKLAEAGFTQIIDVPEGMLGSGAGPGWLARELPLNLAD